MTHTTMKLWEREYWVRKVTDWGVTGIKPSDILADEDTSVNCIGYMLQENAWLWPGGRTWVNDGYRATIDVFNAAMEQYGYTNIDRPKRYMKNREYAVLYEQGGYVTHGARRVGSVWVSKCGGGATIQHKRLEQFSRLYGQPLYFYMRERA